MAPRKDYTLQQMEKAIEAVRRGEKVAVAAKIFGVPRITLHDKVTGKTPVGCAMGPSTVLTKTEEDVLVRWLIALSQRHIPMSKDNLLDSVQKIITEQKRPNPFTNNRPSKKWFQSFLKRHPILTQKVPDNLTRARDNVTENDIINWFQEINVYLEEKNLRAVLADPNRVFNTDESAFFLAPKPGRVLAKRGEKHLYNACGDDKENLTVLITANAAGVLAPPMIIYNYERIPAYNISAGIPDEWGVGKSDSGWMCSNTFYEYVTNVFNPWLEQNSVEKPVLFFLDGHKSHLTLHLSNFCSENGIEIIALYPNSTHILQPMDLSVFRPLKVYWKKAVNEWKMENLGQNLRKENFASVLQKALTNISKDSIKNGFRAGGLFPFGPDYIDFSKIKQSQVSSNEKTIDPAQSEFVKYLDKEIVKIFSVQKLQQFNDFFYKDRNALENSLPNEDMSLYMIWAKNKSDCLPNCISEEDISKEPPLPPKKPAVEEERPCIENDTMTEPESEISPSNTNELQGTENRNIEKEPQEESRFNNNDDILTEQGSNVTLLNIVGNLLSSSTNVSKDTPAENASLGLPAESINKFQKTVNSDNEIKDSENIPEKVQCLLDAAPSTSITITCQNTPIEHSSVYLNLPAEDKNPLPGPPHDLLHGTNTYTHSLHSSQEQPHSSRQPYNDITNDNVTPRKKSMATVLGVTIPSPFKHSLFWPEDELNKKKRIKREKIPFTVTSKAWKQYHEKKEMEKKKQQEEKEKRAKQRIEKKKLKDQLAQDKIKSKLKVKGKKRIREESTSEDTDLEITYAESDESYNIEDDEASDIAPKENETCCQSKPPVSDTESEKDSLPLSKLVSSKAVKGNKYLLPGNYVIVMYEGEYFPGKVESLQRDDKYEVSTMILTKGNTFRWPNTPDKLFYSREEIIEVIKEPICLNKRGFYRILEMDKYLPIKYDH